MRTATQIVDNVADLWPPDPPAGEEGPAHDQRPPPARAPVVEAPLRPRAQGRQVLGPRVGGGREPAQGPLQTGDVQAWMTVGLGRDRGVVGLERVHGQRRRGGDA